MSAEEACAPLGQLPTTPHEVCELHYIPSGYVTATNNSSSGPDGKYGDIRLCLDRGNCRKYLVKTGTITKVNGLSSDIEIYEMASIGRNKSKKADYSQLQVFEYSKSFSYMISKHQQLDCKKIACQRPKSKSYRNLPETAVSGVLTSGGKREVEKWYSRTTLIKAWGRERVDGFLLSIMLRMRPNWTNYMYCGMDLISNNKFMTCSKLSSTAGFGLLGSGDHEELSDGLETLCSNSNSNGEEPSITPSILRLPDELLLQIIGNVFDDAAPSNALEYVPYRSSPLTDEVIGAMPIFLVNKRLYSVAQSVNKRLEISSEKWVHERHPSVLAKASYPLLQCATTIRFDLLYLPRTVEDPIIPQLVRILRTNPVLREVVFEWKPPFHYWPRDCSQELRLLFLNELFAPLTTLLQQMRVLLSYRYHENFIAKRTEIVNLHDYHFLDPLHWAARRGSLSVVRYLLTTIDTETDEEDPLAGRPLFIAAQAGFGKIVQVLLKTNKVDINGVMHLGQTPLARAAYMGHHNVVKTLLDHPDVNTEARDARGRTPLSIAAADGMDNIVETLCKHGVDTNPRDQNGETPLFIASHNGFVKTVKILLECASVDPNVKDETGRSALFIAAAKGFELIVSLLCENSTVEIDSNDQDGRTPLIIAASENRHKVLDTLMKTGRVDIERKCNRGDTALHRASTEGARLAVDALLLTGKVDVNGRGCMDRTPLHQAAIEGHDAVCERLLRESNIDVNAADVDADSALTLASTRRGTKRVRRCPGADYIDIAEHIVQLLVDHPKLDGQYNLWCAARLGDTWLVQHLMKTSDVDPSREGPDWRTPLRWAKIRGDEQMLQLFHHVGSSATNPS